MKIVNFTRQLFCVFAFLFVKNIGFAQQTINLGNKAATYVDANGVLRYTSNNEELCLFGTNYTTPFAIGYRLHKELGVSHEQAILEDVYHMSRLGFDAFRVHVWDCEISDTLGNLLENEHLRLFDFLVKKLKDRGIKLLITPIAYWGNGYPAPDEKTPGFSTKYGKDSCSVNVNAIAAQERYLAQFVSHVNPYTGLAYKDDPDVVAFEVCNEPHHWGDPARTTAFINKMIAAIRSTGCNIPVFYNLSINTQMAEAYYSSNMQGGTFQWYPSGLVRNHELSGNFLPSVDIYPFPYSGPGFDKLTKVVYEFDAADIGRSYMYPFMAKSFRQAGFQFATQFAYDELHLAYANPEYPTHYMNLAYAPQKALSLMIAGEAFHRLPRNKSYGTYPADSVFDAFRVSYANDLAEMLSDDQFIYTNNTSSQPKFPAKLKQVAGYGNSCIVAYNGCGAYFLDKLEDGVWRLELMPDAQWVRDPFGLNSLNREVSVILWKKWPMMINLPDLGENFNVSGLNEGNNFVGKAESKTLELTPGSYLLVRSGVKTKLSANSIWKNISLKEYVAPQASCNKLYMLHEPLVEVLADHAVKIEAKVIAPEDPESVELYVYGRWWRPEKIEMKKSEAYQYSAEIPANFVKEGYIRYFIAVKYKGSYTSYPSAKQGSPSDWDFDASEPYSVRIAQANFPICLFNATSDADNVLTQSSWFVMRTLPSANSGENEMQLNIENMASVNNNYALRFCFLNKIAGLKIDPTQHDTLVLQGHSLSGSSCPVEVALVTADGTAYGAVVNVGTTDADYFIKVSDLRKVQLVNVPETFPAFLPYAFVSSNQQPLLIKQAESVQISIGPGISKSEQNNPHRIVIRNILLK